MCQDIQEMSEIDLELLSKIIRGLRRWFMCTAQKPRKSFLGERVHLLCMKNIEDKRAEIGL
jgi:hypothetical protein